MDLEEVKRRAIERIKQREKLVGGSGHSAELATVQVGQSFEDKQQQQLDALAKRREAEATKEIANAARDSFDWNDAFVGATDNAGGTRVAAAVNSKVVSRELKESAELASRRLQAGLKDDGGAAARAAIAAFKAKQGVQQQVQQTANTTGAISRQQLEAIKATVNSKAYEVPEALRQIEGLNAELFMANLLSVEHGVKNSGENIQDYLRLIHANLTQYPDLTHLLNDDQIALIVQGFIYESKEQVAVASKRGNKSVRQLTAGKSKTDIINMLDMKL